MQGRRSVNPKVKWLFGGLGTTIVSVLLVFTLDKTFSNDSPANVKSVAQLDAKKQAPKKSEQLTETAPPKVEPERGPIDERQLIKIFRDYKDTVPVLKPDFEKLIVGRNVFLRGRVRWTDVREGEDKAWFVLDLDGTDLDVKCSASSATVVEMKAKQVVTVKGELASFNEEEAQVTVSSVE